MSDFVRLEGGVVEFLGGWMFGMYANSGVD
jgi:hypothetical protein